MFGSGEKTSGGNPGSKQGGGGLVKKEGGFSDHLSSLMCETYSDRMLVPPFKQVTRKAYYSINLLCRSRFGVAYV